MDVLVPYELPGGGATVFIGRTLEEGTRQNSSRLSRSQSFMVHLAGHLQTGDTDAGHLDETIHEMVDAVDTNGDHRAELIFELRAARLTAQFGITR